MGLQVKGIPFVVFDAGGVLEMFDHRQHPDNVVFEPTLEALSARLNGVSPNLEMRSAGVQSPML